MGSNKGSWRERRWIQRTQLGWRKKKGEEISVREKGKREWKESVEMSNEVIYIN